MSKYPEDWFADVLFFHEKFCPERIGTTPKIPDEANHRLQCSLLSEELDEIKEAMASNDLGGIADGLGDLIYIAIGCAITHGIDLRPVWAGIHQANMRKTGGSKRPDGKVTKPEGWKAPDIEGILAKQGPISY